MTELQVSLSKCKIEGNVLFLPPINEGMLPNYNEVRTALLNAGAKYKRNTFVFPNPAQSYIDRLIGGEKVNIKQEFQFFATPAPLADYLVELADVKRSDTILEPSAGQGAIIKALHRKIGLFDTLISYCELMEINRSVLAQIENTSILCNDFMDVPISTPFDKIIANPPFNKNQDIDHIRKMYEVCKPKGKIVTIASKHWQHSSNKKETAFREWLDEIGAEIQEIPAGAFAESGTKIATCIIIIDKHES